MDQDSTFMSTIMNHLFKRLNIKIKTVAPSNHYKQNMESLSSILTKHLTEEGQMWPKFLPLVTLAYNMFNSPNLANHSPYELIFSRKPKILLDFKTDPDTKILETFTEYYVNYMIVMGVNYILLDGQLV